MPLPKWVVLPARSGSPARRHRAVRLAGIALRGVSVGSAETTPPRADALGYRMPPFGLGRRSSAGRGQGPVPDHAPQPRPQGQGESSPEGKAMARDRFRRSQRSSAFSLATSPVSRNAQRT